MNKYAALTPDILNIIKNKNTEKPFSGKYCEKKINGSYLCRGCGAVLFRADNQFHSGCGWPSFDGTKKNTRHCVNSLSIEFVADKNILKTDEVIVAGGCFWGMQYLFQQYLGVLLTEVGYTDGVTQNPTYQQVCSHKTNHVEAMRVIFDTEKISYENIIK